MKPNCLLHECITMDLEDETKDFKKLLLDKGFDPSLKTAWYSLYKSLFYLGFVKDYFHF